MTGGIIVVPANEASWEELQAVFGTRGDPYRCQCQRFKTPATRWDTEWDSASGSVEERARRLHEQTGCGHPEAHTTPAVRPYRQGG